ncbi:hypothetical protein [Actinokineospora sp. UTMC 2448]|uniref:hypothetical protein n=1 Tax=Actinokineospora sp. UTMC 2448 TaxID=2268449 RepID=UPI0021648951|nr:hypothetical protein [Actinokineospora sp. UTMC 2448]UVS79023.1 hypothetical protein Actkin_02764 [Actinokineospora sp. UTMC 2448]
MTYPPQQPGPYGGPPQPGYGRDPWRQQGPYQGGYPGQPGYGPPQPPAPPPPPEKSNAGKVVAIVAMALLLLGGTGVAVYFLTRDGGPNTAGAPSAPVTTSPKSDETTTADAGPEAVVEDYIDAYETKSFAAVTGQACKAYKKKYGTDTTQLESQLEKYEITGSAQGAPEVRGDVATARIALELSGGGDVKNVDIEIKIVKEDGEWRFCGEETA